MYISLADVIISLGGTNANFERIVGNTYEGIDWVGSPKFTKDEVEAELERLLQIKERNKYRELRASEYPNFIDYIDGVVKGDQNQINEYIQKCLAVKAKYPKPS